jgi:3-oxoacyl-[acyl-carrier-protein] synthase III
LKPVLVMLARALMQSDPRVRTVLLAGGYRNGDLIDYQNPRVSFMYNLAAGGLVIMASAGVSYAWGAFALRWGRA